MSGSRTALAIERSQVGVRRGFTLVEVIVALVVGAVVMLSARALLEVLGAQATRVTALGRDADADANGERLLRALIGHVDVGTGERAPFGGDQRSVRFSSWCTVPRGWQERCNAMLVIDSTSRAMSVVARLSTGEVLVLLRGRRIEGFRYLVDASSGGRWFTRWDDGLLVPLAIGILVDADTMIVRIGERG
jgi:prepilin-type N-terminal cleavage/methylation domain-containing protein